MDRTLFLSDIHGCLFLQPIGQMMPITNISLVPSTNIIMSSPQLCLPTNSNEIRREHKKVDRSISKPLSSTLVDLLKRKRSPPPSKSTKTNNSSSRMTRQQKRNSIEKQSKNASRQTRILMQRSSICNDNDIGVTNLN